MAGWCAILGRSRKARWGSDTVSQGPSLRVKIIAGVASLTLVGAGVIGYKLTHKGPPSFRRGGQFAIAGAPDSTTTAPPAAPRETTSSTAPPQPGAAGPVSSSTTATTARQRHLSPA